MRKNKLIKLGILFLGIPFAGLFAGDYYTNTSVSTDPDVAFYSIDSNNEKTRIQSTTINRTSAGSTTENLVGESTITVETGKLEFAKAPSTKPVSLNNSYVLHRTYDTTNTTPILKYTKGKQRVDRITADLSEYPTGAYSNTGGQSVYVHGDGAVETYSINKKGETNYYNTGTKSIYSFTNQESRPLPSTGLCSDNWEYKCIMEKYFKQIEDYYFEPYPLQISVYQNIYIPPPLPVTYKSVNPVPGNFKWTVPDNIHSIKVIVTAAGGSGGSNAYTGGDGVSGGGYAGERKVVDYVDYKPGDVISFTVGAGGNSIYTNKSNRTRNGQAGGDSTFGTITSKGGKGGTASATSGVNPLNYPGEGGNAPGWGRKDGEVVRKVTEESTNQWSPRRGGIFNKTYDAHGYGGQGGRGGSGGNGNIYTGGGGGHASPGNAGAGGGGIVGTGSSGDSSGKGGDGYVNITYTVLEY